MAKILRKESATSLQFEAEGEEIGHLQIREFEFSSPQDICRLRELFCGIESGHLFDSLSQSFLYQSLVMTIWP